MSLGEPYYVRSSLSNRLNSHSLHSSSFNPLVVPCFKKVYNGIRSFSYTASFHWNHLPNAIRSAPTYMSSEKTCKFIYLIKLFLHRFFPILSASSGLIQTAICFLIILSDKLALNFGLLGQLATCK